MTNKNAAETRLEVERYIAIFSEIEKRLMGSGEGPLVSELRELNNLWEKFSPVQKEMFYEWFRGLGSYPPTTKATFTAAATPDT
jgi:hypothetical protein